MSLFPQKGWRRFAVGLPLLAGVAGCFGPDPETPPIRSVGVTKWFGGRTFALSVNLDGGALDFRTENEWLIAHGLFLDYELVTAGYDEQPWARQYLFDTLGAHGFGYFGHGHTHINHDALGYDGAYASFKLNHDRMKAYGLTPVSYAYPEGMGLLAATQKAVRDAGFFAARSFQQDPEGNGVYIMPGDATRPGNWFHLPTLRMEDSAATGCHGGCTNNSEEFFAHLAAAEEKGAWLISTYHSIGYDGQTDGRPQAWGYYKRDYFYADMTRVRDLRDAGRLWLARMDDIVRYTRQRDAAQISLRSDEPDRYELTLSHDLDTLIFNHPLTLELAIGPAYSGKRLRILHPERDSVLIERVLAIDTVLVNLMPSSKAYRLEVL